MHISQKKCLIITISVMLIIGTLALSNNISHIAGHVDIEIFKLEDNN